MNLPTLNPYIAYYRVSTGKQGRSGLGLEAQEAYVQQFLKDHGHLVASYTEIESGKNDHNRPLLKKPSRIANAIKLLL